MLRMLQKHQFVRLDLRSRDLDRRRRHHHRILSRHRRRHHHRILSRHRRHHHRILSRHRRLRHYPHQCRILHHLQNHPRPPCQILRQLRRLRRPLQNRPHPRHRLRVHFLYRTHPCLSPYHLRRHREPQSPTGWSHRLRRLRNRHFHLFHHHCQSHRRLILLSHLIQTQVRCRRVRARVRPCPRHRRSSACSPRPRSFAAFCWGLRRNL